MKKEFIIVIVLAVIIVALGGIFVFMPKTTQAPKGIEVPIVADPNLQITSPLAGATVSSPLKVVGNVKGNGWAGFEGQVGTVELLDMNGKQLAKGVLTAITEWTTLPTSFETSLEFVSPGGGQKGWLLFHNENASGDPAKDKIVTLPVTFK
jgi:hypothetical protein